jgi:hypothetical protein
MKIALNPLAQLKKRAERRINYHLTVTAQDLAHDRKRQLAQSVAAGGEPSAAFVEAAEIEGLAPQALAALILAKPDVMMALENVRRRLVVQVRAAKTAAEIETILADNNVPPHPADRMPDLLL